MAVDVVIVSSQMHVYVSQTDRGEFLIGAEVEPYPSYSGKGTFPFVEYASRHVLELFPPLRARLRLVVRRATQASQSMQSRMAHSGHSQRSCRDGANEQWNESPLLHAGPSIKCRANRVHVLIAWALPTYREGGRSATGLGLR